MHLLDNNSVRSFTKSVYNNKKEQTNKQPLQSRSSVWSLYLAHGGSVAPLVVSLCAPLCFTKWVRLVKWTYLSDWVSEGFAVS